jgi:hypothetical protein
VETVGPGLVPEEWSEGKKVDDGGVLPVLRGIPEAEA